MTTAPERDRGSSTVELVILVPLLVLLVLVSLHTVMYFYSSHVAEAAASKGAVAGAAPPSAGGSPARARDAAQAFVADVNSHLVGAPQVVVVGGEVWVTVEVDVPDIVPFLHSSVTRTAVEPLERVVPEAFR